jgi:hypothetical protein
LPDTKELAEKISRQRQGLTDPHILAIIHTQSRGVPDSVYYIGGVWRRVGLMGVPVAWAQELGFKGSESDLIDPATNIEWATKILIYIEAQIVKAYERAGLTGTFTGATAGWSTNAYSFWVHGEKFSDIEADSRSIHNKETQENIRILLTCYRRALGWI